MSSPVAARVAVDALGMTPTNYGHLVMMAARYARLRLDGHAVVNRQTGAPVMLDWERGMKNATASGMPPVLLLAVPAIPAMLAAARYLGAIPPRPPHPPHVLRYHAFEATAEIGGRRVRAILIAQEDRQHRLYLDRVLGGEVLPQRGLGGANDAPNADGPAAPPPAPVSTATAPSAGGNDAPAPQVGSQQTSDQGWFHSLLGSVGLADSADKGPPAPIPLSDIQKPIQYRGADYEKMGQRLRFLNGKYDPQSWGDQIVSTFTGGLKDPSLVMTDGERAEQQALKDKLKQVINDHYNPPLPPELVVRHSDFDRLVRSAGLDATPVWRTAKSQNHCAEDLARLDAIAASPLGTAASLVERLFGASQQTQDATIGAGGALEGMGMAMLGPRPMLGPLPNAPMAEAARPVETRPPTEYRAPPPDVQRKPLPPMAPEVSPTERDTEESPELSAEFAGNKPQSSRQPFKGDFPEVVIHRRWARWMSDDPDYLAAKAGDTDAAERFVNAQIDSEQVNQVRNMLRGRKPVIVAVHSEEDAGRNQIPHQYAEALADRLGLNVDSDIVQINRVGRTGADAEYRLLNRAKFDGRVEPGQQYLIVDDNTTQGGTLADLRGYIEGKGGKVIGASTLTGSENSNILAPDPKVVEWLHKNAQPLQQWWKRTYGYDFRGFTQGEANYVQGIVERAGNADAVRDRFIARRQASSLGAGKGADRPPQGGRGEESGAREEEVAPDHPPDEGRRAGGAARPLARVRGDELEVASTSYGHLVMMTARYARARLDGRTVVNRETHAPIALTWERGIKEIGAPGASVEMLMAVPAIPEMLAAARYIGSAPDTLHRPDIAKVHGFASAVEIGGRRIDVLMVVRENRQRRLFLDRMQRGEQEGSGREVEGDEGRRAGGAAPPLARVRGDELEAAPTSYGHLIMMTARYARARLDGRTVVNRETHAPIALTWERGIKEIGAPGASVEMLMAVPAIPEMLAEARYIGSAPDPLHRPDIAQVYGFASAVEIGGRCIDVLMVVRENRQGRLFLDRMERRDEANARAA